jgi:hypothetical protein
MGLLRKLAELVVEFPEGEAAEEQERAKADDVVAAIEQIRLDLEQSSKTDFSEETSGEAVAQPPAPVAKGDAASLARKALGEAQPAGEEVKLPRVLSIQEVYEQAQIAAGADFDIYRVEAMLADPEIADLDEELRARMVRMTLKNMGRDLKDILADAGKRDQALENYRTFLNKRAAEVTSQVEEINRKIQQEIDDYIARHEAVIAQNKDKLHKMQEALANFERSKAAEEQRLFKISAPFVGQEQQNPVDIDN